MADRDSDVLRVLAGYADMVIGQPNNDVATLANARKAAVDAVYAVERIEAAIHAEVPNA